MAPFRAYDAAVGRWTQVDPLAELVPSLTSYRFGFNNPISFKDPIGLFEESGPGGYTMRQSRRAKRKNARAKRSSQRKARRKRNRSARRQRRNARQQDNHRESLIRAVESTLLEKAHQDAESLLLKLNMVAEANDMPVPLRQSTFAGLPRTNLDANTWSGTGPCILNVGGCNIFASDITHNARGVNNRLNKIVRIGVVA